MGVKGKKDILVQENILQEQTGKLARKERDLLNFLLLTYWPFPKCRQTDTPIYFLLCIANCTFLVSQKLCQAPTFAA